MSWAGHAYGLLVGKLVGKRPLGRFYIGAKIILKFTLGK